MILGGLRTGVTALEMADAYLTLAHGGSRVSGTLAAYDGGPVAFTKVEGSGVSDENETRTKRVIPEAIAQQATQILQTVITSGTGKNAAIGEFAAGKTGTTEDYQDAWFVGFTDTLTVAVWMGYPIGGKPMEFEYHGEPVAGGTYPAEIWRDFMLSVDRIRSTRAEARGKQDEGGLPSGAAPVAPAAPEAAQETESGKKRAGKRKPGKTPRTPSPSQPRTPAEPAPEQPSDASPPEAPSGGSGGAGTPGGGAGSEP